MRPLTRQANLQRNPGALHPSPSGELGLLSGRAVLAVEAFGGAEQVAQHLRRAPGLVEVVVGGPRQAPECVATLLQMTASGVAVCAGCAPNGDCLRHLKWVEFPDEVKEGSGISKMRNCKLLQSQES